MSWRDQTKRKRFNRISMAGMAVVLILFASGRLLSGDLVYSNYWGGVMFAPVGLLAGVLLLFATIFKGMHD